jgi:hypothetical protein
MYGHFRPGRGSTSSDAHALYATHQMYVGEFLPIAHEIQLPRTVLIKV